LLAESNLKEQSSKSKAGIPCGEDFRNVFQSQLRSNQHPNNQKSGNCRFFDTNFEL
jgi:hypothetical protein